MKDAAQLALFSVIVLAAFLLSRRWPVAMRRMTRGLIASLGIMVLVIVATGWAHRQVRVAEVHRWLAHGSFILAWSVIPIAMGTILERFRSCPGATVVRMLGLLPLLGVLFLASVTGYLGPSHGPQDAVTLRRFQVLHFGIWPTLLIVLIGWSFSTLGPVRAVKSRSDLDLPAAPEVHTPQVRSA